MGSHHQAEHGMKTVLGKDANRILHDEGPAIDDALRQGVREALLHTKSAGIASSSSVMGRLSGFDQKTRLASSAALSGQVAASQAPTWLGLAAWTGRHHRLCGGDRSRQHGDHEEAESVPQGWNEARVQRDSRTTNVIRDRGRRRG